MGLNALGLGIVISARDSASATLNKVNAAFTRLGTGSEKTAAKLAIASRSMKLGIGSLVAGAGGLAASFALAGPAGRFEQALAGVRVITQATKEDLGLLRKAAIDAGLATKFSPHEAVSGLKVLGQTGLTAKESMEALVPTLDLATGGEIGIEQAALTATAAMNVFQIAVGDLTGVSDKMFRATQQSTLQMGDMSLALGNLGRTVRLTNQSVDEMLVTLGLVKDTGVDVSTASTATSRALSALARQQDKLKALGVQAVDPLTNKFRNFLDIAVDVEEALNSRFPDAGERTAKAFELFGERGVAAFSGSIGGLMRQMERSEGRFTNLRQVVEHLRKGMGGSAGATREFVDAMLDTFEGQKTILGGVMQTLSVTLGEGFARVLKPVVRGIARAMEAVTNLLTSIPDSVKDGVAKFIVLGSAMMTAVGGLLLFKAAGGAIAAVFAFLLPILIKGAIIAVGLGAALGAVVMVIKALKIHADNTGRGFGSFFGRIKLGFQALAQLFSQGGFSGDVMKDLNKAENSGVKSFAIKVFVWVGRIKNFLTGLSVGFSAGIQRLRPVFDTFVGVLGQLLGLFGLSVGAANKNASAFASAGVAGRSLGDTLATLASFLVQGITLALRTAGVAVMAFGTAWEVIASPILAVWGVIEGVVQSVVGLLSGDWTSAWNGAVKVVHGVVEVILKLLGSVAKIVTLIVDAVGKAFGKDLGLTAAVREGLDVLNSERIQLAAPTIGPASSVPAANPGVLATTTTSAALADVSASNRSVGAAVEQSSAKDAPINLNTTVKLDSEVLGRALARANKGKQSRAFSPRSDD